MRGPDRIDRKPLADLLDRKDLQGLHHESKEELGGPGPVLETFPNHCISSSPLSVLGIAPRLWFERGTGLKLVASLTTGKPFHNVSVIQLDDFEIESRGRIIWQGSEAELTEVCLTIAIGIVRPVLPRDVSKVNQLPGIRKTVVVDIIRIVGGHIDSKALLQKVTRGISGTDRKIEGTRWKRCTRKRLRRTDFVSIDDLKILLGKGIAAAGIAVNPALVVLSSIIIFIPGLALTVSLTEISAGHLISGCSRLVEAIMTLLKLFFGALSGIAMTRFAVGAIPQIADPGIDFPDLPPWRLWPALIGLALSLGIGLNLPPQRIGWGVLAVMIGFTSAMFGEIHFGMFAGVFLGALAVGLYANVFSRIMRGPGSILMTYGIIVLVPGSKIYSILNEWVSGETILPSQSGSTAVMAFMALTAGLLFSNAFLPARKSL